MTHPLRFPGNQYKLTVSNPHLVQFAGRHRRLRAHRVLRPLYFLVGDGQSPAVDVVTKGPGDAVIAKLINPQGKIAAEKIVASSMRLTAEGPSGIWSITIQPAPGARFEGIRLGLAPPLAPYLSDAPERLLRERR